MTPETKALLYQCRTALLRRTDEQVDALLRGWFANMIGDEYLDEAVDDLCLLLDYRVQTFGASTCYDTYTAWWEVEGYLEQSEGIFTCADVGSLRLRLLDMPIKQFNVIVDLAYQARSCEGEVYLPTGHEGLRECIAWLESDAPEVEGAENGQAPYPYMNARLSAQSHMSKQEMIDQASHQGYLMVDAETGGHVKEAFRHWCKTKAQPYIWVEVMGPHLARLCADTGTVMKQDLRNTYPQLDTRLSALAAPYLAKARASHYQSQLYWASKRRIVLEWVLIEDAEPVARELVALWSELAAEEKRLSAEREAARLAALEPMWSRELKRWQAQEQSPELPLLAEEVALPAEWGELFTREELSAFLTFLGLPVRSRDAKATIVQRVQERLISDQTIRAQFFEVFKRELAVPPWELETLLACTPTERKRWTEEGKLPVLEQRTFRKGGTSREYPVFDRRIILCLPRTELETWRAEYQALVKEHRSAAAQVAAASRKAKALKSS